jgi:hypothetical protein
MSLLYKKKIYLYLWKTTITLYINVYQQQVLNSRSSIFRSLLLFDSCLIWYSIKKNDIIFISIWIKFKLIIVYSMSPEREFLLLHKKRIDINQS